MRGVGDTVMHSKTMLAVLLMLTSSVFQTTAQDPNEAAISAVGDIPICAVQNDA